MFSSEAEEVPVELSYEELDNRLEEALRNEAEN